MNSKLILIFILSLIISTFAKKQNNSIEGEWTTISINNSSKSNGHMVITKDTLVTYYNNNEDSRVAYTKNRKTLTIDGEESTILISEDTLTIQNDNQTIKYLRFNPKKLSKSSQKMLKTIKGEWFIVAVSINGSMRPSPKNELTKIIINSSILDIFINDKRMQSNHFTIKKDHLQIENTDIFPKMVGDTLKLISDSESMMLLPLSMASVTTVPSIEKEYSVEMEHCKEAAANLSSIITAASVYEAETGKYPPSLQIFQNQFGLNLSEKIWTYSFTLTNDSFIVRATLNDGITIGDINSGEFIEFDTKGEKKFSHDNFHKYLKN